MSFTWLDQLSRRLTQPVSQLSKGSVRAKRRGKMQHRAVLHLEKLESREVPAAFSTPAYIILKHGHASKPLGNPGIGGFIPSQIYQAYGINQVLINGAQGNGAGTTIAIVDAYSDPTITTDLQAFDKEFGLPNPVFKVVNQTGGTTLPPPSTDWAGEISLDVEWSHAIAPDAHILLVEANSSADSDLFTAVRYAEKQPNVVAVSMSFGGGEFSGETAYDTSTFNPSTNQGLVFLASSGDHGAPPLYPSASPDVLAVGGTSLYLTSTGNYSNETGWGAPGDGSSTGGVSQFEKQPAYQKGVVSQWSTTMRTTPDVSLVADPETGLDIYQTYGNSPTDPWEVIGGTSDASPQWAGLVAITDQGRALIGEAPLNNTTLMPELYSLPTTSNAPLADADFHDILTGMSIGTPDYSCTKGYDLVTGIGTPIVNNLIPTLIGNTNAASFKVSAPVSVDAGLDFSVTVTALSTSGKVDPGYTGTVTFSSSDGLADLPGNYTFSSSNDGVATFDVTLNSLGSQTVTVSDVNVPSATGTVSVNVAAGYTFGVSGFPSSVTAGEPGSITVTALAANGSTLTSYSGTAVITSSDPTVQPLNVTLINGVGTFNLVLDTAGVQSITATDSVNTSMTGSETGIIVTPAGATHLVFLQQPTSDNYGAVISPAVTVAEEDQYNNIEIGDSSTKVSLALGSNPGGAALSGGGTATLTNGVATYSNLSLSALGSGYTLVATSPGLTSSTSQAFGVAYNPTLENFTNGLGLYNHVGGAVPKVTTTPVAAHPGTATMGLSDGEGGTADGNWYFRTDAAGQLKPGDTVSVWVQFAGAADGRAYFGFGSTTKGTISVVLAPNTNQFMIQTNAGYDTYTTLAASTQTYSYNTWYQVKVTWGLNGTMTASLYASNGTTEIQYLTVKSADKTPGDFAFRAIGSTKYFSTVYVDRSMETPDMIVQSSNSNQPTSGVSTTNTGTSSGPRNFVVSLTPQSAGSGNTSANHLSNSPSLQTLINTDLLLLPTSSHSTGTTTELTLGKTSDKNDLYIEIMEDGSLQLMDKLS
jgi:hypothetical protein